MRKTFIIKISIEKEEDKEREREEEKEKQRKGKGKEQRISFCYQKPLSSQRNKSIIQIRLVNKYTSKISVTKT